MFPHRLAHLAAAVAAAFGLLAFAGALLAPAAGGEATCDVPGDHSTIQGAVDDPACDVANVAAGTFYENVVVGRDVTIRGQGQELTTVDGSQDGPIFNIGASLAVTIAELAVAHGVGFVGGGIYSAGGSTVVISATAIVDNSVIGFMEDGRGAGIYQLGGSLAIANSTLSGNTATNIGGAIFVDDGELFVMSSTLSGNIAARGGGLAIGSGGSAILEDAAALANISGGNWPDGGGGIYNEGTLMVNGSTLDENESLNGNRGGAILNLGILTATGTTLFGNVAQYGGAIFNDGGTASIANGTLAGNSAHSWGGGIYNDGVLTVAGSTFTSNWASDIGGEHIGGGAIQNVGWLTVTGSTFSANSANAGGAIGNARGGWLLVADSVLTTNSAGSGGAIANLSYLSSRALDDGRTGLAVSTVTVQRTTFGRNAANWGGSAISNLDGLVTLLESTLFEGHAGEVGGAIANVGTMTVTGSTLVDNAAVLIGGGIYNGYGQLTVAGTTLNGNAAGEDGGGIVNYNATLAVVNSTFSDNSAANRGGAIHNAFTTTLSLSNSALSGNEAAAGGGIYTEPPGTGTLANTIVAYSTSGGECAGSPLWSLGYNLASDGTCNLTAEGDQPNIDPLLGPLQDNGGPTWTHALLPGSPALDAGNPAAPGGGGSACEPADQRGISRPRDGDADGNARCDIGAYELWRPIALLYLPVVSYGGGTVLE